MNNASVVVAPGESVELALRRLKKMLDGKAGGENLLARAKEASQFIPRSERRRRKANRARKRQVG